MTKKAKKNLAKQTMDEFANNYNYSQILDFPWNRIQALRIRRYIGINLRQIKNYLI